MDYLKSFGIATGEGKHQEEAFYGLILTYNLLFDRIAGHLQGWGLTPAQFNVLLVLDKHSKEDGLSQVDISKKLIVTASNTTRLLEKMEKEKLIVRSPKLGDRRVNVVHITPKGSTLLAKIWPEYDKKIREAVSLLSQDDQKMAASLFIKWLELLGV